MTGRDKVLWQTLATVALLVVYVLSIGPAYTMPGTQWKDVVYWPLWQIAFEWPRGFNVLSSYICFWLGI